MKNKTLYAIEYDEQVVWDYDLMRDAIYTSLYNAKQDKHDIYHYYKNNFEIFKNVKFKDFKIVEYIAKENMK